MRSCRRIEDTILKITNPSRRYIIPTVKESISAAKRCGAPQVSDFECTTFFLPCAPLLHTRPMHCWAICKTLKPKNHYFTPKNRPQRVKNIFRNV